MFGQLFTVGIILWLSLAIAVGFHAKGHNRSGIIWFGVVAITGIFGLAFYLLAITSADSKNSDSDSQTDKKIIINAPIVVLGFFVGAGVSFGLLAISHLLFSYPRRPEPFYPVFIISGLIGAVGGLRASSVVKNTQAYSVIKNRVRQLSSSLLFRYNKR